MHYYGKFDAAALRDQRRYSGHHEGYTEASLVNDACGSVHTLSLIHI